MSIGEKIKIKREEKGWTLDRLSIESGVGLSLLSRIENNKIKKTSKLKKIASALGVDENYFKDKIDTNLNIGFENAIWSLPLISILVRNINKEYSLGSYYDINGIKNFCNNYPKKPEITKVELSSSPNYNFNNTVKEINSSSSDDFRSYITTKELFDLSTNTFDFIVAPGDLSKSYKSSFLKVAQVMSTLGGCNFLIICKNIEKYIIDYLNNNEQNMINEKYENETININQNEYFYENRRNKPYFYEIEKIAQKAIGNEIQKIIIFYPPHSIAERQAIFYKKKFDWLDIKEISIKEKKNFIDTIREKFDENKFIIYLGYDPQIFWLQDSFKRKMNDEQSEKCTKFYSPLELFPYDTKYFYHENPDRKKDIAYPQYLSVDIMFNLKNINARSKFSFQKLRNLFMDIEDSIERLNEIKNEYLDNDPILNQIAEYLGMNEYFGKSNIIKFFESFIRLNFQLLIYPGFIDYLKINKLIS